LCIKAHANGMAAYGTVFLTDWEILIVCLAQIQAKTLNPSDKRLAMMVEDHPFYYLDLRGLSRKGNYGAGTVIVWDCGTYGAG